MTTWDHDSRLPQELARCIIDFVDDNDVQTLLSLMLSSKLFHYETERLLYRNFTLTTSTTNALARANSYLGHITKNPRLATFVMRFRLLDFGSMFIGEEDPMNEIFNAAESILRLTTNLKEFSVEDLVGHPRMHQLLHTLPAPVHTITYQTSSGDVPTEIERVMMAISANPNLGNLRRIDLHSRESGDVFSDRSCPPVQRCSDADMRGALKKVNYLGGDGYTIRRLRPLCGPDVCEMRWYTATGFKVTEQTKRDAYKELLPGVNLDHCILQLS